MLLLPHTDRSVCFCNTFQELEVYYYMNLLTKTSSDSLQLHFQPFRLCFSVLSLLTCLTMNSQKKGKPSLSLSRPSLDCFHPPLSKAWRLAVASRRWRAQSCSIAVEVIYDTCPSCLFERFFEGMRVFFCSRFFE